MLCLLLACGCSWWAPWWTLLPALAALLLAARQVLHGRAPGQPAVVAAGVIVVLLWAYGVLGFLLILLAVVAFASLARTGAAGADV